MGEVLRFDTDDICYFPVEFKHVTALNILQYFDIHPCFERRCHTLDKSLGVTTDIQQVDAEELLVQVVLTKTEVLLFDASVCTH